MSTLIMAQLGKESEGPYFKCLVSFPAGNFYSIVKILLSAFKLGGFAVGPAVVSLFLQPDSYLAVIWVCCVALLMALVLITPVSIKLDKRGRKNNIEPAPAAAN